MELKYILFLLWKTSDFVVLINNLSLVSPTKDKKIYQQNNEKKIYENQIVKILFVSVWKTSDIVVFIA